MADTAADADVIVLPAQRRYPAKSCSLNRPASVKEYVPPTASRCRPSALRGARP